MNATLLRNGIKPPANGRKTTCPECSAYRKKRDEKCLRVWQEYGLVWWKCFHCDLESSDVMEAA